VTVTVKTHGYHHSIEMQGTERWDIDLQNSADFPLTDGPRAAVPVPFPLKLR
jgi:hypothetical protein